MSVAVNELGGAMFGPAPRRQPSDMAYVLREEPDLANGLSEVDRRAALSLFRAPVINLTGPEWDPPEYDNEKTFGLLVLDGLLGRRLRIGRAVGTELLSSGDIIRPWDEAALWEMIAPEIDWRVFTPTRLAVLDERLTALIGRRPQLTVNFSSRLLRRARAATYLMTVSHLPRVEERVLATLWHIASSWGKVKADGVTIPFRLTHDMLSEIVGAHRPSISVAMQSMQNRGQLVRRDDGYYVLVGDPPSWPAPDNERAARADVGPRSG